MQPQYLSMFRLNSYHCTVTVIVISFRSDLESCVQLYSYFQPSTAAAPYCRALPLLVLNCSTVQLPSTKYRCSGLLYSYHHHSTSVVPICTGTTVPVKFKVLGPNCRESLAQVPLYCPTVQQPPPHYRWSSLLHRYRNPSTAVEPHCTRSVTPVPL